jgi:hypothetical protein
LLQVEHTPLEQLEQEPFCSLPSWLKVSDAEAIFPTRLNLRAVCELLQCGHLGLTLTFMPFSISKVLPQSAHLKS